MSTPPAATSRPTASRPTPPHAENRNGAPPAEALEFEPYADPAGGWGSIHSLGNSLTRDRVPLLGPRMLMHQNKPDGYMCVSCAWAKPADPHVFEFCENGAKATTWEITSKRCTPEFFSRRTVMELQTWDDHHLERVGRLTDPLRYDSATDRYLPVSWQQAFADIGARLRGIDPKSAVFYASGRASLETAFAYGLFARAYGHNNLPDSSNMCHETTSVALPESIGVPVGTVILEDFEQTDCIFFLGQNVGTSSPRMLHQLQAAARRGVPIVTFNPLRERGLERFANPQSAADLLWDEPTRISSQYHQVKAGGDLAAILGICKALLDLEASNPGRVLDSVFIREHTLGYEAFAERVAATSWQHVIEYSGLTRSALEAAAAVYARSRAVIFVYGMGLTQHRRGVETVQTLINLALLRGNLGKTGAGICPVRGHSNVQGQRTVGITEKPHLVPADELRRHFGIEVPPEQGLNTVDACQAILERRINAFLMLGGNFVRAVPERSLIELAWRHIQLTVQVLTKLNRSALVHGKVSYLLPCLGRTEIDRQASGPQAVSMEDSTGCMHGSRGMAAPASPSLRSELAIVAGIAKATLSPNPSLPWDEWVADYSKVRDAIALCYPDIFHDFNARMWQPGGFHRPIAARQRRWNTPSRKANFITPRQLVEAGAPATAQRDVLRLITLRSNGQFNTTVYNYHDRFRGVRSTRMVLFMNRIDIDRLGLAPGQQVTVSTAVEDGTPRELPGLGIVEYDIPEGCIAGYYPECNVLIPLSHHADRSKVPAAKAIPVRVRACSTG